MSEAAAAPAKKPKRPLAPSMIKLNEQTAAMYENARQAKERGEMVGWSSSIFPQEIAQTLGVTVLYPENHSAGIAARHQADPYLQKAEGELGFSNDICAYAKVNLAYAEAMHEGGNLVLPDFLLCANNICNQLTKWYERLSETLHIPLFFIDCCYNAEDYVTSSRVRYIRAQIDDVIEKLSAFTGKAWDEDRFRRVMEISAQNNALWERANESLMHRPAPINGFELFNYMGCMVCHRGEESTTEILQMLNDEIDEHIRTGTSTYPVKEEYRIFWDGIACWPYLSHNLRTLKSHGINMVASSYAKAWAIKYSDLDGMARAYSSCTTNNANINAMVQRRTDAVRNYHCDGLVCHLNRSCKVMDCQMYEAQRQISANTGAAYTIFDGDQADYRNYSEAQFETRIQGLVEVMKAKKEVQDHGGSDGIA